MENQSKYFPSCHWNVDSLIAHNKISVLQAYNTIHRYVICLSKAIFDFLIALNNHYRFIQSYSLIWVHPVNDVKNGGVYLYFKENLTLLMIKNSFIAHCVVFEITLHNQKGYVFLTYRSPIQSTRTFT